MNSLFNLKIPIKKINQDLPKNKFYTNLTQEEQELANSINKTLNENLYTWDTSMIQNNSDSKSDFNFNLPASNFTKESLKINFTDYTKWPITYHTSVKSLDKEHLKEISEDGCFRVRSNIRDFPYKFKISKLVITGKKEVYKNFHDDLGLAFACLYDVRNRFFSSNEKFNISFKQAFRNFKKGMVKLIDIFVGLKEFDMEEERRIIEQKDLPEKFLLQLKNNFEEKMKKETTDNTGDNKNAINGDNDNSNNFNLDLSIHSDEFRKKYSTLLKEFYSELRKSNSKSESYNDTYKTNPSLDEEQVLELFKENQIQKFISYLDDENKGVFEGKEKLIIDYIRAFNVYKKIEDEYRQKLDELESKTKEEIKTKHKIKSYSEDWLRQTTKSEIAEKEKALIKEKLAKIETELSSYPQPQFIWVNYLNFIKENSVEDILKYKEKNNLLTVPKKRFVLCWKLKAPYEVLEIKTDYHDSLNNKLTEVSYAFKEYEPIKIDSTRHFWKLRYIFKSYLTTTNNIFRSCLEYSWNSSFGIKALYKKELELEDEINPKTGEITKKTTNETYRGMLAKLVAEIRQNRLEFEQRKATGLFGKGVERIFNLTYNYICKGLCEGFLYGVVYPSGILGLSTINFVISMTSWIWSIGYIGLKYPFNVLIYNSIDDENKNPNKYRNLNNYSLFPLPRILVSDLAFGAVLHSSLAALCAAVQPAVSLAVYFWALVRFALQSMYNAFMLQVLRINGRIPQSNTRLAWIISGPGVSKNYYNYLSIDDSLVLVECELEKLALLNRRQEIVEYLNDPIAKFDKLKSLFNISHLDFTYSKNKSEDNKSKNFNSEGKYDFGIEHSVKAYEKTLFKQVQDKISVYPTAQKVRFTREELNELKNKACNFIESYVTARKMDFLWEKFKIAEGSWISLTEEILKSAFSGNILECLEENDLRVEVLKLGDGENLEKSCLVEIKESASEIRKKRINRLESKIAYLDFYREPFNLSSFNDNKI